MFTTIAPAKAPRAKAQSKSGKSRAEKHRQRAAKLSREVSAGEAEIGQPPKRDAKLWKRYRFNLFLFLVECFPKTTGKKPFSDDHREIIERIQQCVLEGGQELIIWFRGSAKSTILELTAIWAAGYGHRVFFVCIGSDKDSAKQALDSIQSEFETNDFLMKIFPAACHCARALEGIAQRAGKQSVNGSLTKIEWTNERCVLPTVPGFEGSGAIIWPKGVTANMRGMRFKRPDGTQARPDFIMGDDLQTDETALSPAQNNKRLSKINKTILRMGGHDTALAIVVLGTVIEPDDAIDQLSKPELYPGWRVARKPMLRGLPTAIDTHWRGKYAELRTTYDPNDKADRKRAAAEATAYYADNREVMDAGCEPSWECCYISGSEISAIQHAMNILIDSSFEAFMAECQATPQRDQGGFVLLTPDQICNKQSAYARDEVPAACNVLTTFIDSHPSILYWEVWAWEPRFTGYCINYGTFPDQHRHYFAHDHLSRKLQHLFPHRDQSATIDAGIDALLHGHAGENWPGFKNMEWTRADGAAMRLSRIGADANGADSDAIHEALRRSSLAGNITPTYGRGVTAKNKPISRWAQSAGAKLKGIGPEWVPTKATTGQLSSITFDSNYWKARFHRGLKAPAGSQGALYLFKTDNAQDHRRVADHWYSEKADLVKAPDRSAYEFTQRPGTDNHDLDTGVGNMVMASRSGITSVARTDTSQRKKRRAKYF